MMQQLLPINKLVGAIKHRSLYTDYFFAAMALLFIVFAVVGFGQDYELIYAQHIKLEWFVHVHGVLLTLWLLVFFTQSILAVKGNFKFHRKLGQLSVVLGMLVFVSIGIVIFHGNIGYPIHKDISWADVMLLSLTMGLFGLFFTWGILVRKNGPAHKRLLFLATLVLIAAGLNRVLLYAGVNPTMQWIHLKNISLSGMPSPSAFLFYNDLLMIPLYIYDFIAVRHIHSVTLVGTGCILAAHVAIVTLWQFLT